MVQGLGFGVGIDHRSLGCRVWELAVTIMEFGLSV
jgi:hypothetical protein